MGRNDTIADALTNMKNHENAAKRVCTLRPASKLLKEVLHHNRAKPDEAFNILKGSTDTEHLFALFVDEIIRNGCPVDPGMGDVTDGEGAMELARRLSGAIARVLALADEHGDGESSFLNVAVADGRHVAVCRFDTDPNESPESLYLLHGEMYEPAGRRFPERRKEDEGEAMVVSSERLTGDPRWQVVAPASMVVLDRHAAPRILPMDAGGRLVEA